MTKQRRAAMAAMLMVGTVAAGAQEPLTTTTKTVKVAPGETKTTVITKENGAAGKSTGSTAKSKHKRRTRKKASKAPGESATVRELRELRATQAAQQAQIDSLTQANAAKDAALAQAQTTAQTAETQAQAATAQAQTISSTVQANTDAVQALKSNVTDLQTTNTGLATTISQNKQELTDKIESPTTLHYKGITITPVAFFAFEGVFRQRGLNSDIPTPFNTTPYPGSNEAHLSELNFTARQSRLGGLFEGNAGAFKLSGYFEADFLSAGVTTNSNQSSSYTMRERVIYGRAETKTGFSVTGGQMWSLVTEDGKGTDNRTEKIPLSIDPNYIVGFSWARQPAIRLAQKIGNPFLGAAVTVAVAAEQGQTQLAGQNLPANFIFGGAGTNGGLFPNTANYTNNVAPDLIAKIAFDAKYAHFEAGGLGRFFRDEYFPAVLSPTTGAVTSYSTALQKNTKFGGGVFASGRVSFGKALDFAASAMAGDGTARYGASQLGDVTAHPDGTLEPIRNYHGLISLEAHPAKKLDIFGYAGGEYNQRTLYAGFTPGLLVGYGPQSAVDTGCSITPAPAVGNAGTGVTASPATANCTSSTRAIEEGVVGFIYRAVVSPKYGRLQYEATYSYLTKTGWTGVTGGTFGTPTAVFGGPKATNNIAHVSMRYYIP